MDEKEKGYERIIFYRELQNVNAVAVEEMWSYLDRRDERKLV